jgi:hypothetical protein
MAFEGRKQATKGIMLCLGNDLLGYENRRLVICNQ